MKKKRYPTYKRKYKRKKQLRRKILTAIILCVILAVCNGWMPPRSLKEVKDQSRIFGQVFLTYIEENAQILWEDISESASDAVTGLLKQSQTKTGGQTESVSLDQIPEYSGSPYVVKQLEPEIEGVLVAAQGAGDETIVNEITYAVQVLFDVPVHKIKVVKMSSR